MDKVINVTYASSLTNLCEVNSSFDTGILRICYTGDNRNGSHISKEAIKKSLPTIYNCPIVCNYDRETDTLGGHDVEIVRDSEGGLRIVNITQPIGVIPESAKVWFDKYEEEDGTVHEYLYAEVLLWKRQEAYRKIFKDGITSHSMEITVKDGAVIDGVYHINDFEFTAFALIGVTPCFEGSALEMFSKQDFKQQLSEMMQELKESLSKVNTSNEDDNIHPQNYSMEGGEEILNEKMDLVAKYGIDVDKIDFSIADFTVEELEKKFKLLTSEPDVAHDAEPKKDTDPVTDDGNQNRKDTGEGKFTLESNIRNELARVLESETVQREWGECTRYWFVDYDKDSSTVYCVDTEDWLLYGFPYIVNGDSVTIDYTCKKRKKYEIVDFDEGEQMSPIGQVFAMFEGKIKSNTELEAKYQTASDKIASMETELDELRKFKSDTELAITKSKRDEVFAHFNDLIGIEAFDALKENCIDYDIATLEEKCFAIRGRNSAVKFSVEPKSPKLKVDKTDIAKAPYGGLFEEYGVTAKE